MRLLVKVIDKISVISGIIAAPLPFLAAIFICYEIVMRKFLDLPTLWVSETTAMLCAVCYLMGGAINIKNDAHVRVDIIYSKFSPRVRAGVNCLNFCFFSVYILVMLVVIWPYMVQSVHLDEHSYTAWNPMVWPLKIVLFVGFCLVFLQGLASFIRNFYRLVWNGDL